MKQIARELTDCEDGFLNGKQKLAMDRDTKFNESFCAFLDREEIEPVVLPARSPNLNWNMERFFGSLKRACLNRMIFFGESSLRLAIRSYVAHYHGERYDQGLDNGLIESTEPPDDPPGDIECRERLGGTLKYDHSRAA